MSPKRALLTMALSAALTWCLAILLMNIAERKREGRHLEECPCQSVSCPHPSRGVK